MGELSKAEKAEKKAKKTKKQPKPEPPLCNWVKPIRKIPANRVLAIDPGNEKSAWIEYDPGGFYPVGAFAIDDNEFLLQSLKTGLLRRREGEALAIEMMKPRGMPTSFEELLTCVWIGRFIEAWGGPWRYIYRTDVKMTLCGRANAKDSNIRAALVDKWGGKKKAIGLKKTPGPLYGIKADLWQALAAAVTYTEKALNGT